MLYPQSNKKRFTTNLNGIWNYKPVDDSYSPSSPAKNTSPMAVPSSINDITNDIAIRDYVGKVLFERYFSIPTNNSNEYMLRIGALSQKGEIFLNGKKIGSAINGFYPVDIKLDNLLDENRLTIIIDNRLDYHTFPTGRLDDASIYYYTASSIGKTPVVDNSKKGKIKQVINHDFYNFTGIHRDVLIYSRPLKHIEDIKINTVYENDYKKVKVDVSGEYQKIKFTVYDGENIILESNSNEFIIENPILWDLDNPHLYTLAVETENDFYKENFGIRKISYDDKGLYLNDKFVYLKGFGMHEDFFVIGKGNNSGVNVKNFELLKWTNANSIRTSHYPYSEEIMDLADKYGILVIDEVPAVGVNHWGPYTFGKDRVDDVSKSLHKELVKLLLERDKNHPSVCMLSVANETATFEEGSRAYYKDIIDYARTLTKLPIIMPEETKISEKNYCADLVDFIGLNRYFGWYDEIGNLECVAPCIYEEIGAYYKEFHKPIIMTEFGADTIEGLHSITSESFSEEYQRDFYKEYCRVLDTLPYVVGEHAWNLADFKTKQGVLRVRGNRKGVFTKDRQPKEVAFFLKERWAKKIK